ncbi:MAG: aspartyl protease family protein [Planctomycetota bacterium]|nr:aspartyl protease family protein [Planctomycetota bacterium]
MIDTGATGTVVREDLVHRLGLHPVGMTLINTPSSTNISCMTYSVRLFFPGGVTAEDVAIAVPLQGQNIECLVGRDILRHGVSIYTGYMNTFTMSF